MKQHLINSYCSSIPLLLCLVSETEENTPVARHRQAVDSGVCLSFQSAILNHSAVQLVWRGRHSQINSLAKGFSYLLMC